MADIISLSHIRERLGLAAAPVYVPRFHIGDRVTIPDDPRIWAVFTLKELVPGKPPRYGVMHGTCMTWVSECEMLAAPR